MIRPHITVILAMSADGKIADAGRSPARFGSLTDRHHLETQVAQADGVMVGAQTLRAYGSTILVKRPELLHDRQQTGKPPQPIHLVCSRSGNLSPQLRFFQQPISRWLVTTPLGAEPWQQHPGFERILLPSPPATTIDWPETLATLVTLGIEKLAVLGGGELIASLLAPPETSPIPNQPIPNPPIPQPIIDDLWLTVCPLLIGGAIAPTPLAGLGFSADNALALELLSSQTIHSEVFLHYRLQSPPPAPTPHPKP